MKTLKQFFDDLGLDGLIFGVLSLVAMIFGVISFIGTLPAVTSNQLSSILISSVGILMAAVVALTAKRKNEIEEIKNAIGISESKIINSPKEAEEHFAFSARQAQRFILDTSLNHIIPESTPVTFFSGFENEYRRAIYERVKKGEISFKRVEIIFHRQGLEWVIFRLLLHEDYHNYLIRHYEPSAQPIPMLSFLSFDNTVFYLGGFHLKGSPTEEHVLIIREPNFAQIFSDYWNSFWNTAIPLNEGGVIQWDELKKIGLRVGFTEQEFEELVNKLKAEVIKEKRKVGK